MYVCVRMGSVDRGMQKSIYTYIYIYLSLSQERMKMCVPCGWGGLEGGFLGSKYKYCTVHARGG